MKTISIDVETTGLDPLKCQLLEVALVSFDTNDDSFEPSANNCLRIVVMHETVVGEPVSIAMNAGLLREINRAKRGFVALNTIDGDGVTLFVPPHELNQTGSVIALALCNFYQKNGYEAKQNTDGIVSLIGGEKLNLAGKNYANFDRRFLEQCYVFKKCIVELAHHRVLDVGSLCFQPQDLSSLPSLYTCAERTLERGHVKVAHCARDDAILVVQVIQKHLNSHHIQYTKGTIKQKEQGTI